jgi:hypothetical protein
MNDPTHAHSTAVTNPAHKHQSYYTPNPLGVAGGGNQPYITGGAYRDTLFTSTAVTVGIYGSSTGTWVSNQPAFWLYGNYTGISIYGNGSDAPHENMSPFLVLTYVIRASYSVPQVGPSVPLADTTQPGLACRMTGLGTDFIGGDNAPHDFAAQITLSAPIVRSYNALGNPGFEQDKRTVGIGANLANVGWTWVCDRWQGAAAGSHTGTAKVLSAGTTGVVIAGTSYCISSSFLRYTLTAQAAALASSDYLQFHTVIEGSMWRELLGNASSPSLVVRSSLPVNFGVAMLDNGNNFCLTKLASVTNPGAWTLVQLPNCPVWPPTGNWSTAPGIASLDFRIVLAAGSSLTSAANNVWASGAAFGANTQDNFCAAPLNSTFDIGWVQLEPGAACNGILDKNYQTNELECARYYYRSYTRGQAVNTVGSEVWFVSSFNGGYAFGWAPYQTSMATTGPTIVAYDSTAASGPNTIRSFPGNILYSVTSYQRNDKGLSYMTASGLPASQNVRFNFTADTGL